MSIILEKYNPDWPKRFEQEQQHLAEIIGDWCVGSIEHIGSTSIPDMIAKPIIDIMVGVESLEASRPAIDVLQANGYCYYPYKPDVMHWFCKPSPDVRTHHVHLVPYSSQRWINTLTFRDVLRQNPILAAEYAELKRALASEHTNDREAYTQRKWPFIQKVLNQQALP